MLSKCLAGALGALLLSFSPLAAQTDVQCATGRARGSWDLPAGRPAGYVKGLLVDDAGHRLLLEGRLTAARLPDGRRGGRLDGVLSVPSSDRTAPRPVAETHGVYVLGLDGRGSFEAEIVALTDGSGEKPQPIGKLAGSFADPMRDGLDPVGQFVGRWAICR